MKKTTATATLAIGLMVLFFSNVQANYPTCMTEDILKHQSELTIEKKIVIQGWMLSFDENELAPDKGIEQEISLETWMIDANWNDNNWQTVSETEIELEDWMYKSFTQDNRIMAQNAPLF